MADLLVSRYWWRSVLPLRMNVESVPRAPQVFKIGMLTLRLHVIALKITCICLYDPEITQIILTADISVHLEETSLIKLRNFFLREFNYIFLVFNTYVFLSSPIAKDHVML